MTLQSALNVDMWVNHTSTIVVVVVLQCWLAWKLWIKPDRWGLGVGIFFLLCLVLQIYLWNSAIQNPRVAAIFGDTSLLTLIVDDIPLFITMACCFLLRVLPRPE